MAGLMGLFDRLFGRAASAEPRPADPAAQAFAAAAEIATSYGETAGRNVASLVEGGYRARILEPFEMGRMLGALNVKSAQGMEHYVLHSFSEGRVDPVMLRLLWDIHRSIGLVEAGIGPHLPQDEAIHLCQCIEVDSHFLAAEYAHAVRIANAGLGARVYDVARNPDIFSPDTDKGDRHLAKLIRQHRTAIKRVGERLQRAYPQSHSVRDRVDTYLPVETPIWLTVKDHDGAMVINDVWFPADFAKPLLDHLADTQARATGGR